MIGTATAADALRRPLLVLAVVATAVALLLSLGSSLVTGPPPFAERVNDTLSNPSTVQLLERYGIDLHDAQNALTETVPDEPPGMGIPALALILGELLLILALTALPLLVGDRITGTVNSIASLIGGLLLLLASIAVALLSFAMLQVMLSLLLAPPFGTLTYLALFGSFNAGGAAVFTSAILFCVVACLLLLVFAQQRFLASKGLVALIGTAALLTLGTAFLHSLVPGFLVSIADAAVALVTAIVSAIWALCIVIWGVVAAVRLLQLGRQSDSGQTSRSTSPGRTSR